MSHTATITTVMKSQAALLAACKELGLPEPKQETVRFFDGKRVTGLAVRLPGWNYPVVVEQDGKVTYDDYNGSWGKAEHLTALKQHYALAVVRATYGKTHRIAHAKQADGSLRIVVSP